LIAGHGYLDAGGIPNNILQNIAAWKGYLTSSPP